MNEDPLLQIRNLNVSYPGAHGRFTALSELNLELSAGECLGLVGESGSGKTALLLAILGLLPAHAAVRGSICYRGGELLGLEAARLNAIRGARIAMVFQDPMSALNPYMRVIDQLSEVPRVHGGMSRREARRRALAMLEAVHIGEPERRALQYPHELSGGMRQRTNIIRTLIYEPEVIMMDEPFGPLDAQTRITLQDQLLKLWDKSRATVIFITHDLTEAIALADRVVLMSARPGRIVSVYDVTIPRPRDIYHIHDNAEFRRLYDEIWQELEQQVRGSIQ
jgi:ABC-type glutathione transport system ATPase component